MKKLVIEAIVLFFIVTFVIIYIVIHHGQEKEIVNDEKEIARMINEN